MDKYIQDNLIMEDMTKTRDEHGNMTFEYLLKVHKTAMIWSKILFTEKKKEMAPERRQALKDNQMETYNKVFKSMEEQVMLIQDQVLTQILDKIGFEIEKYGSAVEFHMNS